MLESFLKIFKKKSREPKSTAELSERDGQPDDTSPQTRLHRGSALNRADSGLRQSSRRRPSLQRQKSGREELRLNPEASDPEASTHVFSRHGALQQRDYSLTQRETPRTQEIEDKRLRALSLESQLRSALDQNLSDSRRYRQPHRRSKSWSCQRCELQSQEHSRRWAELSLENQQLRNTLDQRQREDDQRLNDLILENKQLSCTLDKNFSVSQSFRRSKKSSCKRCERQAQEHQQTISEMEVFYKDKLSESRSALKEKEEQLRSFKDRVAQNVVLSLKTENTENMNSPVNQSRLTEMYQQLRVCTWPNLQLTCSEAQARTLVQEMFRAAAENMRRATETVYGGQASSPKVEKFRQTAQENLQLALYHSSKQDVFKAAFPHRRHSSAELQLACECYWLGCLMALHSPPLRLHWDGAHTESVFPRDIRRERRHANKVTHL